MIAFGLVCKGGHRTYRGEQHVDVVEELVALPAEARPPFVRTVPISVGKMHAARPVFCDEVGLDSELIGEGVIWQQEMG